MSADIGKSAQNNTTKSKYKKRYRKKESILYDLPKSCRWTDVKQDYDEFVEQSREMEAEMDATLEQKQSIIKDLRAKLNMLEKENDSLKVCKIQNMSRL